MQIINNTPNNDFMLCNASVGDIVKTLNTNWLFLVLKQKENTCCVFDLATPRSIEMGNKILVTVVESALIIEPGICSTLEKIRVSGYISLAMLAEDL